MSPRRVTRPTMPIYDLREARFGDHITRVEDGAVGLIMFIETAGGIRENRRVTAVFMDPRHDDHRAVAYSITQAAVDAGRYAVGGVA